MSTVSAIFENEHNEREHDPGTYCEDDSASLEYQAQALAESYNVILLSRGEVVINGRTHTWQEVLDEDLDNILELQRKLHKCHWEKDLKKGVNALKDAQVAAVNDWATRTARERVGL